jgi:hypothetical protein
VQVRHDEGVAIRIDPKPCAVVRKGDNVHEDVVLLLRGRLAPPV